MFEDWKFKCQLRRLISRQAAWERRNAKAIAAARKRRAPHNEIERIQADGRSTYDEFDEDIALLQTAHLRRQAWKLQISIPVDYTLTRMTSSHVFTSATIMQLREAIRKERKDRSEVFRLWLSTIGGVLGALTGLLGATIGLLAFLYGIPKK